MDELNLQDWEAVELMNRIDAYALAKANHRGALVAAVGNHHDNDVRKAHDEMEKALAELKRFIRWEG